MMERPSPTQVKAMQALQEKPWRSAYPGLRLDTLRSLETRGLALSAAELGSMAFPRTSIRWTITEAGRTALNKALGKEA